jgi:hypothetical protein
MQSESRPLISRHLLLSSVPGSDANYRRAWQLGILAVSGRLSGGRGKGGVANRWRIVIWVALGNGRRTMVEVGGDCQLTFQL